MSAPGDGRVDVDLPGGRALRVELERGADGGPGSLRLTVGHTAPWRPERGQEIRLPGYALGEVRKALADLAGEGE